MFDVFLSILSLVFVGLVWAWFEASKRVLLDLKRDTTKILQYLATIGEDEDDDQ